MDLALEPLSLRCGAPLVAAWGALASASCCSSRLTDRDGLTGRGEAAPLEPYDGVSAGRRAGRARRLRHGARRRGPGAPPDELIAACRAERDLPQAAGRDRPRALGPRGPRAGAPVHRLLHPHSATAVPVNATIGAEDRAGAAAEAAAAVAAGFRCVKVKVGVGDDAGRVAAVRAAAARAWPSALDANGAWATPAEALANLEALAPCGLELAEEPVHGVAALRAVRERSPVPIAMDETAAEPAAIGSGAADAVCLKVSRCGGITGVLQAAADARAAGSAVYLASTFDGPLGIAAALHAAAALAADGPLPPCGLATLGAFDAGMLAPAPVAGALLVPGGPGLMG